jgi:hypothetical protein
MTCPKCKEIELDHMENDPQVGIDEHYYCWKCDCIFDPWLFADENY